MKIIICSLISVLSSICFADEVIKKNPTFDNVTSEKPFCYSTTYTEKHLKAYPKQTVQSMKATLRLIKESDERILNLEIVLKSKQKYNVTLACVNETLCLIDADGGTVSLLLKNEKNGIQIVNNGIRIQGDEEDETTPIVHLPSVKGGDDIFNLYPIADQSTCK